MNNIDTREPIYSNTDMVKLANTFGISLDNLVIRRYSEIADIENAVKLFDISYGKRKEVDNFLINSEKPTTISPEFIFLCLKFNPQFYNFAQMVIADGKKKKLKKGNELKSLIANFLHKKTK